MSLPPTVAGRHGVWAKLEHLNPTLSFKDRTMALGASIATDIASRGLGLASTGNAAVSAAAYAAAAGLPCAIVCAEEAARGDKLALARSLGAEVTTVAGDYSTAYAKAIELEAANWFNVTTTYRNPLLAEAYRTVAYEMAITFGSRPIDAVVVPVGAGPLLRGIGAGFADLESTGGIRRLPRLIGVQGAGCNPLVHAWHGSRSTWLDRLESWGPASPTLATAIADPLRGYEREGLLTLESVSESRGALISVDDDEIRHALRSLSGGGFVVEATAASTLAALPRLADDGVIKDGDNVVLLLTGHGMKERSSMQAPASGPGQGGLN